MVEENSFPKILKAFIVITLFAFIILSIVLLLANNYNQDTTEISERIGLNAINRTLSVAQDNATAWQTRFKSIGESQGIFEGLLDILGFLSIGIFSLVKSMITFIFLPFSILSGILVNVLGINLIIVNIINVLIILGVIFGIWSLVKRGV